MSLTEKSTEQTFTKSLQPGNLIRTKRPLSVHTVHTLPKEGEKANAATVSRIELGKHVYLLALTAVTQEKIGTSGSYPWPVCRYQIFALHNETIVCFTCIAINDRLTNKAFEIVQTDDPNA